MSIKNHFLCDPAKPENNLPVSAICLGTMTYGQQNNLQEASSQLEYAIDHGVNFIDTAEMYPVPPMAQTYTRTESIIGEWLKGWLKNNSREKVVIATKAAGPGRMQWIRNGADFSPQQLQMAVDDSLSRLNIDTIDLYQLHWPMRNVPNFGGYDFDDIPLPGWPTNEEQVKKNLAARDREIDCIRESLHTLKNIIAAGKIRYIGLSNEHPWGVMQFLHLAENDDLPRVVSVQNSYNLLNRTYDLTLSEMCVREGIGLLAYSPLAFGLLTGKYFTDAGTQGRLNLFPGFGERYSKENVIPACKAYTRLAQESGISPATLALSWQYHRNTVASTIIGATTMAQLQENIAAWNCSLSVEIMAEIERIHLRYFNPAP